MEVILKKDVPNCGRIGELVKVKPGFARNFLLPRQLAVVANKSNKSSLEHFKRLIEREKIKIRAESEAKVKEFEGLKFVFKKRFNESGKMFGNLTGLELVQAMREKGFEFDKRDFIVPDIKDEGTFKVKLRLAGDVMTTIEVKIEELKETGVTRAPKEKKLSSKQKAEAKAAEAAAAGEDTSSESVEASAETSENKKTKKSKSKKDSENDSEEA